MKKLVAATAFFAALAGAGSADAALYISQIYGGGGATASAPTYTNDWVELYNNGPTAVNLSGYSLQYASATNTTMFAPGSNVFHALSGSIAANSYFLIQEAGGGKVGGAADPAYNLSGGPIALSATAGKIALFSSTATGASTVATSANLVDLVGFGTSANFSLYPKMTANTSTTTSALRTTDALGVVTFVAATPVLPATPTPIPAAAWLLGSGLLGLAGIRRRNA